MKEAVLPFNRFPEVDPALGPEMRSTGEVMGIDAHVRPGVLQGRAGRRARCCRPTARCSCRSPTATSRPGSSSPSGCASSASASPPPQGTADVPRPLRPAGRPGRRQGQRGRRQDRGRPDRRRQGQLRRQHAAGPRRPHRRRADPQGRQPAPGQLASPRSPPRSPPSRAWPSRTATPIEVRSLQELPRSARDDPRSPRGRRQMRRLRDADTVPVGSVELPNPVMTASGTAGLRDRAGAVPRPRRRSARSSSSRSPRTSGRATRRRGCTRRRRDAQRRRAAGPRRRRTGSTHVPARPAAHRRHASWPVDLGPHRSTTTPRRPSCWPRRRPSVVAVEVNLSCPNLEGRRGDLRPRPRAVGRGDRRDGRLRAAALGQAQRQHRPHRRRRRRRARRPAPRRSRCINTLLGLALDPTHAAAGARRRRRRAVRAGHPSGRRARRATTSTPRCPTCRSSASAAWPRGWDAAELLLAGAVRRAGRHGDVRRPAGAGRRCSRELAAWPARTASATLADLTGAPG